MDRYCPYFNLMMLKRFGVLGEDQSEVESLVKLQREGSMEAAFCMSHQGLVWSGGCSCWLRDGLGDGFLMPCCSSDVILHVLGNTCQFLIKLI